MNNTTEKLPKILEPLNGLLIAISFFTRIPVQTFGYDQNSWRWSTAFFPFTGYLLGALATIPFALSQKYQIGHGIGFELITPFLYLTIIYWMNRMLHLDGFCDCCDGFSAMTDSPQKRLEIMKDPHNGSTATGAAILLILGKGLILFILIWQNGAFGSTQQDTFELVIYLAATPAIARFAIVLLAYKAHYPRKKGTGLNIIGNITKTSLIISLLSLTPLLLYLDIHKLKISLAMLSISVLYWRRKSNESLGGITGDTLGACCETTELMILLGLLISP